MHHCRCRALQPAKSRAGCPKSVLVFLPQIRSGATSNRCMLQSQNGPPRSGISIIRLFLWVRPVAADNLWSRTGTNNTDKMTRVFQKPESAKKFIDRPSFTGSWPQLHASTTKAAAPFAVFEGLALS
jgi:hypothetical protein